jgi:hypothetical protein
MLTVPVATDAVAAPANVCSAAFCTTFDMATYDALAPTQPTTAAGQPTNLRLRFTDTSAAVATSKLAWLAKVSAQLGASSTKGFAVTDPATLPPGSYVAGTAATALTCLPGADGSGYATSCPAGFGSGYVDLVPVIPGPSQIKPFTYGIQSVTAGAGGGLTAAISVWIPTVTVLPLTASAPITFSKGTTTSGPALTLDTRLTLTAAPLYTASDASLNDITLNLNGLVTEATAGPVNPPVTFTRQALLCTAVASTLSAHARGPETVLAPLVQTTTGCPAAPTVVSIAPVAGQPKAMTFTMGSPTAAVAGRTASLEWVFGDGATAVTGATTTHTYPVTNPVTVVVTTVDSAGARSPSVQVQIGASAVRGKQKRGDLITGSVTDAQTGTALGKQTVTGYRCATRNTPIAQCQSIGTATTTSAGRYRLHIPRVKKKGFVVVAHAGTATTSATTPARFGSSRAVDVLPQPTVTLRASSKQVHPGATVKLSGRVHPGKKGKKVRLQGRIGGKWRSLGTATISQTGRYALSYVVKVPGQSKLKVRAVVDGTAATLAAKSKVVTLTILR